MKETGNWFDRHGLGALNLILYVFRWHRRQETEELAQGKPLKVDELDALWPRPWLWSRVLLLFAVCFALLYLCWVLEDYGSDSRLLPGMTFVGALAFPLSMLLFFFEINKFRSISLLRALYYFVVGSCVSVVITFILTTLLDYLPFVMGGNRRLLYVATFLSDQSVLFTCLFEEIGKTLVILVLLMHFRNHCYILQGLLVGAAVGAGFSVFESVGYALDGTETLLPSILMRNLMAPTCHAAWGAIMGGGIMLTTRKSLSYTKLFSPVLWLLFAFVWALHFAWNYMIDTQPYFTHNVQLALFTLFIVFLLIWAGVRQIGKIQSCRSIFCASEE